MPFLENVPSERDIVDAHLRIKYYAHRTPVLKSKSLNKIYGSELHFKCENLQKAGAFKFRGAANAMLSLTPHERIKGVATHSSGNHAGALALAAKMDEVPSYIVMPDSAPFVKKKAVAGYGAEITFCESTTKARVEALTKVVDRTGAAFIHPFDNYSIIAGQATAAMEFFEDAKEKFDCIIAPVGGGGLLSGTCLAAKYFSPGTKVYAAEPEGADDAFRSIRDGIIYPQVVPPNTICDGLLTGLCEKTYGIIKDNVHKIITVSDEETLAAMRDIWERMKIIVEPSAAVTLAAVKKEIKYFVNKRVGIILSGGNVDLAKASTLFNN